MADRSRQSSFWINGVDRLGRGIDPIVLAAAEEVAPGALQYGERLLRDPALAATLFEESAATVSRVLRLKRDGATTRIRNLQAYVFRTFVRRVNRVRQRDLFLLNHSELNAEVHHKAVVTTEEMELRVLVSEFLARCDAVTRDMFYRRMQGFSWKEIGRIHDISAHAAESKFSQALRRVRKKLGLDR